jgi:ElaB/YqjD/DUF883 family membrane-anchored ribosome-binding protein
MAAVTESDLHTLQSQIQDLRNDFTKTVAALREVASSGVQQAGEAAQASAEKVWDEVKRQANSVTREIEERPLTAALTAFGTGIVLGFLLSSRR